ncbi:thioredoxin [Pontibacter sp. G13]|uniref:thioredoxin n=1 Tax=Pontibacter sp. G13 TaxID=3074898 RepID=UPI00288AFCDB|nr:thioredoxin [Pontibacter sp. G13]WNJ20727.1 thioredoxin [Pontibacter sp. G13]
MQDFQSAVLERSHEIPVVVDFWAEWCGPCRVLGPVIESLAQDAAGRWELVKVDTEAHQELARQYAIQSIPAVKMFYQGEVIAEFAGALPKSQIQQWLDKNLPDPRAQRLAELSAMLRGDQSQSAHEALREWVQQDPSYIPARISLAFADLADAPQTALDMVSDIRPGHPLFDQASDLKALAEVLIGNCEDSLADSLKPYLATAQTGIKSHNWESALEALIHLIMINKPWCNELSRRATVAIFRMLGESHPITKEFRPRFSRALY